MPLDIQQAAAIRANPSNWEVLTNAANGSATTARNRISGEDFSGTNAAFNAIFSASAMPSLGADDVDLISVATPVLLPGSGTVATNGTIAITNAVTGLQAGACWIYLPAGAVVGGAAGYYYAAMTTNQAGQVYASYQDPALPFVPFIPVAPVAAVGSNAAYTAVVTELTMLNVRLPANAVSSNGKMTISARVSHLNGAPAKVINVKLGSTVLATFNHTTTLFGAVDVSLQNRGVANKQVISAEVDSAVIAATYATLDTTADLAIIITGTTTNVSECMTLEGVEVSIA